MLFFLVGCLPLPYVAPPLDLGVAVDPRPTIGRHGPNGWPQELDLRGGVAPLAFIDEWQDRRWDPTAGVIAELDGPIEDFSRYGGYLRVAYRTARKDRGNNFVCIEPRGTLDVTTTDHGGVGGRLLGGVNFRAGGWTEAEPTAEFDGNGGFVGVAHGEWGVSAGVDLGVAVEGGQAAPSLLVGVEFRPPAAAGVLFVPIW